MSHPSSAGSALLTSHYMNEQWLPVIGYEGSYEVSNFGNIRSLTRVVSNGTHGAYTKPGRYISKQTTKKGYKVVHLCKNGTERRKSVHSLVLEAFFGSRPSDRHQCNHKDGVKANNILDNLEWCTPSENRIHALKTGLADMTHLVKAKKRSHYIS